MKKNIKKELSFQEDPKDSLINRKNKAMKWNKEVDPDFEDNFMNRPHTLTKKMGKFRKK